jgi:hypothetical protein
MPPPDLDTKKRHLIEEKKRLIRQRLKENGQYEAMKQKMMAESAGIV